MVNAALGNNDMPISHAAIPGSRTLGKYRIT